MNPRLAWMLSNRIFLITLASICCLYGLLQLKAHGYSADKVSPSSPLCEYPFEPLLQADISIAVEASCLRSTSDLSAISSSRDVHSGSYPISLVQAQAYLNASQVAQAMEQKLWAPLKK